MFKKYGSGNLSDDSGEISWASSDNEGTFTGQTLSNTLLKNIKHRRRKKKRGPNLSNLNVTITADAPLNGENQTSPIFICTNAKPKFSLTSSIPKCSSPILCSAKPKTCLPSPILKPVNSPVVQTPNLNYIFPREWAEAKSADCKKNFPDPQSPILKRNSFSIKKPLHSPPSPILTPSHSPLLRKHNKIDKKYSFSTNCTKSLENNKKPQNLRSQITGSPKRDCPIKSPILSPKNTNFTQRSIRRKLILTDARISNNILNTTATNKLDIVKTGEQEKSSVAQSKMSPSNTTLRKRKHMSETATLEIPDSIERNNPTIAEPQITSNTPNTTTERRKRTIDTALPSLNNVSVLHFTDTESPKSFDTSISRRMLATTESMAKDTINMISSERGKLSIVENTPKTHNSHIERRKPNYAELRIPPDVKNASSEQSNDINLKDHQETHMTSLEQDKMHLSPVLMTKRTMPDLLSPPDERMVKKIKSYFDNYFSTQTSSQVTISDSTPQSQKTINVQPERGIATQIDITESPSPAISQDTDIKISVSSEKSSSSKNTIEATSSKTSLVKNEVGEMEPKRKRRYKKDGLANRLQVLLKKQRNQQFLWRHEIYLAANSNFVVPNLSPFRLFGITKVCPDYGNYLIEAVDTIDQKVYLILLNTNVEYSFTVSEKSFFKLYEPFEVVEAVCGAVIVNACKFECINVKKEE